MIIKIYLIIITVIIIIIIILFFYQISQVIFYSVYSDCNTLWTVREKRYINVYYCHYYLLSPVL